MSTAISSVKKFTVNILNYSKSGKKYWLNVNSFPVVSNDNEIEYFVAIERNITSEYEQNQYRLNKLIEEQQKLSAEKSELIELIYLLTHDLKAPLDNIEGFLNLVNIEDKKVSDMLFNEISRSRVLINKILTNGNNIQGDISLDFSIFSLLELIQYLNKYNENSIVKNDLLINIDCSKNIKLYSDKVLVTQILENIFINAIKYSTKSTRIDFEVIEESDAIKIDISNETKMLEDWQIDNLFKPFQNFNPKFTNESNGIGSYIIHKYLGLIGGSVTVFRTDDRVTFRVSIKNTKR